MNSAEASQSRFHWQGREIYTNSIGTALRGAERGRNGMKIKLKKATAMVLMAIILVSLLAIVTLVCVEAKGYTGMKTTKYGDTYIVKDGKVKHGWEWYKGHRYYCHETSSEQYPAGTVFKGGMKLIGGKVYCFDSRGRQVRKNTRYVKLNGDKSVKYVYMPGTGHSRRYNTAEMRYQVKIHGHWKTEEGMAFYPYGMIDTQG